jgi:hypothetical protein
MVLDSEMLFSVMQSLRFLAYKLWYCVARYIFKGPLGLAEFYFALGRCGILLHPSRQQQGPR